MTSWCHVHKNILTDTLRNKENSLIVRGMLRLKIDEQSLMVSLYGLIPHQKTEISHS